MSDVDARTAALLKQAIVEIREMRGRLAALEERAREPIAIVGIGCRFPGGANGPDAFWRVLAEGVDAVREVPKDRWDVDALYSPDPTMPGRMTTRWGGFLDDVDQFEPSFFGISVREAAGMDPQQRLVLEVAFEALEDAGIAPERLAGTRTGVFVGSCFNDYYKLLAKPPGRGGSGTLNSIIANRVSYTFDLRGPSLVVDTACSSSLVAVDLACRSLRSGASDAALAGGVNLVLSPEMHLAFSQAGMTARDGRCKTFDARADGYTRGEGCGIVVLKRLSSALAARDRVLAVIRGSAVNQDGATNGLSAPNGLAQQAVLRDALEDAGIDPARMSLIEAHGTGTPLGDPIEVEALREVYGPRRPDGGTCVIGSVKTNIGHLEAAAGIAGLIKIVLCLQREAIPPHLHFRSLNEHIALADTSLRIVTELAPFGRGVEPRFASVSSFGVGGTNAHVIVEEAPPEAADEPLADAGGGEAGHVLALSAKTEPALAELARRYLLLLAQEGASLADICHTAGVGRRHFAFRLAVPARSMAELRPHLEAVVSGAGSDDSVLRGRVPRAAHLRIGFAFGAGGEVPAGAGERLSALHPAFRDAFDRCRAALDPLLTDADGPDPLRAGSALGLFALQIALAAVLRAWNVAPSLVEGAGVGDYAAAHVAGALTLEDAAALAIAHVRLRSADQAAPGAAERGQEAFALRAAQVAPLPLRVPLRSRLDGRPFPPGEGPDAGYWARSLRAEPASSSGNEVALWLEVGPPGIAAASRSEGADGRLFALDPEGDPGWALLRCVAALYVRGAEFDWAALDPAPRRRVALPTYPFQRRRCWLDAHELRSWKEIVEPR